MLERTAYLDRINGAGDEPCVKTLAGIRHGGKSFLFYRFISGLKRAGIDDEHIIYLNFERAAIDDRLRTAREIEALISEKTEKNGKYYLFLDEIQTVSGWERAVASLRRQRKLNIYIAVSDAAPLLKKRAGKHEKSGALDDLIYVKPLSFAEYKQFFAPEARPGCGLLNKAMALKNAVCNHFDNYIRYGGFPAVYTGLSDSYAGLSGIGAEEIETMAARLNGIYSSILLNDVIRRSNIRNVELLELIIDIIFLNIGKENSTLKITEYLRKKRYKKNLSLVNSYIKALENAFVLKKVYRCNLETGRLMNKNVKYFIGDHALLNAVKGIKEDTARGIGENILVHDLERRGYAVYSGKLGRAVIDFAAVRENDFIFLQTIDKTSDGEAALDQKIEYLNLLNGIEKFYLQKKYVVFLDGGADKADSGGVCFMSLQDFLLRESV
jgi:predicted AAA+ superfamily ATPase